MPRFVLSIWCYKNNVYRVMKVQYRLTHRTLCIISFTTNNRQCIARTHKPVSQLFPVYPGGHQHQYLLVWSSSPQVPPFLQGLLRHSLTSENGERSKTESNIYNISCHHSHDSVTGYILQASNVSVKLIIITPITCLKQLREQSFQHCVNTSGGHSG